jgi:hypothetical protein
MNKKYEYGPKICSKPFINNIIKNFFGMLIRLQKLKNFLSNKEK